MKKIILQSMTLCATCLALAAQAQNSQDSTSPGSTSAAGTQDASTTQSGASRWQGRLSATGRTAHQELRASKLMGSEVKTSAGESLGKIEDVVINPSSGRIDFAVISFSGGAGDNATPTSTSTSTSPAAANASSSSGEKLVPLPWSMLQTTGMAGNGTTGNSGGQPGFVFSGDKSKLEGAPSFDRNNWPDVSQGDWHQRIFSYYGTQSSGSTGGATSPGGVSSGESSTHDTSPGTSSSQSSTPDSTPVTPK